MKKLTQLSLLLLLLCRFKTTHSFSIVTSQPSLSNRRISTTTAVTATTNRPNGHQQEQQRRYHHQNRQRHQQQASSSSSSSISETSSTTTTTSLLSYYSSSSSGDFDRQHSRKPAKRRAHSLSGKTSDILFSPSPIPLQQLPSRKRSSEKSAFTSGVIATGIIFSTILFGGTVDLTTTTTTTGTSLSTSTFTVGIPVANAVVDEKNELLCGTGFFTNIYQYKCTDIGDIEKEGKSKDLSTTEISSVSNLMDKLELSSSSSSGSSTSNDSGSDTSSSSIDNGKVRKTIGK